MGGPGIFPLKCILMEHPNYFVSTEMEESICQERAECPFSDVTIPVGLQKLCMVIADIIKHQ